MTEPYEPNPDSQNYWERECAKIKKLLARKQSELNNEKDHSAVLAERLHLTMTIAKTEPPSADDIFCGKLP